LNRVFLICNISLSREYDLINQVYEVEKKTYEGTLSIKLNVSGGWSCFVNMVSDIYIENDGNSYIATTGNPNGIKIDFFTPPAPVIDECEKSILGCAIKEWVFVLCVIAAIFLFFLFLVIFCCIKCESDEETRKKVYGMGDEIKSRTCVSLADMFGM